MSPARGRHPARVGGPDRVSSRSVVLKRCFPVATRSASDFIRPTPRMTFRLRSSASSGKEQCQRPGGPRTGRPGHGAARGAVRWLLVEFHGVVRWFPPTGRLWTLISDCARCNQQGCSAALKRFPSSSVSGSTPRRRPPRSAVVCHPSVHRWSLGTVAQVNSAAQSRSTASPEASRYWILKARPQSSDHCERR